MNPSSNREWLAVNLPVVPYPDALALQHRLVAARITDATHPDLLLLLEHAPVYTLGRRGGAESIIVPRSQLEDQGIAVLNTERGGFITYHGPGQLVVYPIVDITARRIGVAQLVAALETAMIATAARWGVTAGCRPENRGVWVANRKLGSIGIAVRRGVAFHGLALNVTTDLTPFTWINPCGLENVSATSLAAEGAADVTMSAARTAMIDELSSAFDTPIREIDAAAFEKLLDALP
ncbi:MAG: lipoyl(octanoyl) transferase LipB [Pseudomonadota bacterium]